MRIRSAANLPAADLQLLNKEATSDPYVRLQFGQRPPQRTKSVPKNLSPLWGESFRFNGVSLRELSNTPLRLLVCDEDKGRLRELGSTQDDVLGQLEVRLDAARVRSTDPSKHEYKLTFQPAANLTVRRGQQPILEFAVYWTAGGPPAPANALPQATATPAPPQRPPVRRAGGWAGGGGGARGGGGALATNAATRLAPRRGRCSCASNRRPTSARRTSRSSRRRRATRTAGARLGSGSSARAPSRRTARPFGRRPSTSRRRDARPPDARPLARRGRPPPLAHTASSLSGVGARARHHAAPARGMGRGQGAAARAGLEQGRRAGRDHSDARHRAAPVDGQVAA